MIKTIQNQIQNIEDYQRSIFWSMFLVFIVLLFSYGFLINNIIANASNTNKMTGKIATLNSEVDSLEYKFLSLKNSITLESAKNYGFIESQREVFAYTSPKTSSVALSR